MKTVNLQKQEELDHQRVQTTVDRPSEGSALQTIDSDMHLAEVTAELRKQARRQQAVSRSLVALYFAGVTAYIVITVATVTNWFSWSYFTNLYLGIAYAATLSCAKYMSWRWRRTAKRLAAAADLSTIGAFIEGLEMPYQRRVAEDALMEMLPRLRASDSALLDGNHRQILRHFLGKRGYKPNTPLVCAILAAYEQIGTPAELPNVELLARGRGYAMYDPRVRAAAEACLPGLLRMETVEREQQTLLRASDSSNGDPAALLRPAEESAPQRPEEMLRAAAMSAHTHNS